MISAEAPVLFAKAAQIFITELTLRAWIHTEDNKRRTLQVRRTHRDVWTLFLSSPFYSLISPLFDTFYLDQITLQLRKPIDLPLHCLILFLPYLFGLSHPSIVMITCPLSSVCTFLPSFSILTPLPHPCIIWLFGLLLFLLTKFVWIYKKMPHTSIPLSTIPLFSSFSLHWLWKQSQTGAVDPLFPPVPFCLLCCPKVE